ncbi:MAG: glycoside hydrolase family 76 protein [Mycobacteriales bacterium]
MIRALTAIVALATLTTTATLVATASSAPSPATPSNATRAEASFTALQRMFGTSDGSDLYRELYPTAKTDRPYSYEWPFSQVHVAALDLTGLPSGAGTRYLRTLTKTDRAQLHYWDSNAAGTRPGFEATVQPPYGKGGTVFYDDNEWVGLEAIQDYAQHHNAKALQQAEKIFDLAVSGWDRDTTHPRSGGVYWMQARRNNDRNTVSNMPAAELGFRLYQVTKQRSYLSWALKMYRWTNRNLQDPDGLYYDHVDLQGQIDRSFYSYNQGVPIAANVALYRITNNRSYLNKARRIAAAAYDYFVAGGRLHGQSVAFNAIFFKDLLVLESLTGGKRFRAAMEAYADWMWDNRRDPNTGVFNVNGKSRTDVLEQAAATQVYATLAWPRSALPRLA